MPSECLATILAIIAFSFNNSIVVLVYFSAFSISDAMGVSVSVILIYL